MLAALSSHSILSGAIVKEPEHAKYDSIADSEDEELNESSRNYSKHSIRKRLKNIARVLDAQIFKIYPLFIDFQLLFLIFGTALAAWVLFLVPNSMAKGVPTHIAAFLSTVGGIGHVFGRLAQGPLITFCHITDVQLFGALSLLCAVCFLSDLWLSTYIPLAFSAFVVGFATGAQYTLALSLTKRIVTRTDLVLPAMGWTHLFIGIGKMIGGPLVGK